MEIYLEKIMALIIERYGPNLTIPVEDLDKDMSMWAIAIDPTGEKEDGSFEGIMLSLVETENIEYDEDPS